MTLAEMLDVVEDKAGFERLLQTLDVPAYSISSPVCVGQDRAARAAGRRRSPVRAAAYRPAGQGHAAGAVPAHPSDVRPRADARVLPTKEDLAEDVVALLRAELAELAAEGADFVQFDEPVLTELAFAPGRTRTFMCAALAARRDPAEELELAVSLINRVVDGVRGRADRRARVPRQLEPRRDDAAERQLSAAGAVSRAPRRRRSSCSSTPPSAPAT